MKYSLNWIKKYIDIELSEDELYKKLTMSGSEVEGCHMLLEDISDIVISKINKIEPHPQADKLQICTVTDGKETYSVVCGATNIQKGQIVPLAKIGASLPGNMKIKRSKIRGIESEGMLCSTKELGLGTDHEGIFILKSDLKKGKSFKDYFDDTVFEIEITPNRPDLLSHYGLSREIAAITGKRARPLEIVDSIVGNTESPIRVEIRDLDACPKYLLLYVKNIENPSSPQDIKNALIAMDTNPKSLLVDLSNYNLFETGHPTHFFDADKIQGNIIVRFARKGEKTITLDGEERVLQSTDLVIADEKKILAIAGVIGCANSEVSDSTKNIAIESAVFKPALIRKTKNRLGIKSDAAYRYERGVDINAPETSLKRIMKHFREYTTFEANSNVIDVSAPVPAVRDIVLKEQTIKSILGVSLESSEITNILLRLGFKIEKLLESSMKVTVPTFRYHDIEREIDLVEEVGRIYSFERIPAARPYIRGPLVLNKYRDFKDDLKHVIAGRGFHETVTLTVSEDKLYQSYGYQEDMLQITNPLNISQNVFAPLIFPRLINVLIRNLKYRPEQLGFFEIGNVFSGEEKERISILMYGKRWGNNWITGSEEKIAGLFDLKGELSAIFNYLDIKDKIEYQNVDMPYFVPGRSGEILLDGAHIGWLGQVEPDNIPSKRIKYPVLSAEFDLKALYSDEIITYEHFSMFPEIERDLAVVFPDQPVNAEVISAISSAAGEMLTSIELKDVYKLKTKAFSMMYRLTFQSGKKTLKDKQVDYFMTQIIKRIEGDFDAKLR